MNQRKRIHTGKLVGEANPWQALAGEIVLRAVKDFRNSGRMLHLLRRKLTYDKELTEEEKQCLLCRIEAYQVIRTDLRQFFKSGWFSALCDLDGSQLLKRLERERT